MAESSSYLLEPKPGFRIESDLLGEKYIPNEALYGVQTLRGMENFDISQKHHGDFPHFISGFAYTKWGAAEANFKMGLITEEQRNGIVHACKQLLEGKHYKHFPVDMIQGGAGTSANMNANEVIANLALEYMGKKRGEYEFCSPNDVVNCSQSTNDAYPTAIHFALYLYHQDFGLALNYLVESLEKKAKEYEHIIKMGRTQLQDAVPMTLGQTFQGFADLLKSEVRVQNFVAKDFLECNMGATAIGTGINSEPGYSELCVKELRDITGWNVRLAKNLVEVTSDTSCMVGYSGILKRLAIKLGKICNDLRLMSSGPRCGLGEINLPPMQPGSSIMPGKVNPVIPEVVNQICFKVIGNDVTVTMAADAAQLELNVMEPVIVYSLFESFEWLMSGMRTLRDLCINGITANEEHCKQMVLNSIGIVTALNPHIGYKNATKIAKEALETGASVYDLVISKKILTKEQVDKILSPENMIKPTKFKV
ncbi:MAG: aspartate ammonia-lyase [Dysgonamonadaceae bacterium]|jgi:aspartate ammonia-lyase|nr:aspartate ammonia-lyase [Dysgonamonadaceae bacterium]